MRSQRINFLASITATAGLMGFIGVYADWFSVAYQVSGVTVVLDYYGTLDGTGAVAVAAGLGALMFACAYMLLQDPAIRRITSVLMVVSSVILFAASAFGFSRVEEAFGSNPLLPGAQGDTTFEASIAVGLVLSFLSGLIATVASILLISRRQAGQEEDVVTSAA